MLLRLLRRRHCSCNHSCFVVVVAATDSRGSATVRLNGGHPYSPCKPKLRTICWPRGWPEHCAANDQGGCCFDLSFARFAYQYQVASILLFTCLASHQDSQVHHNVQQAMSESQAEGRESRPRGGGPAGHLSCERKTTFDICDNFLVATYIIKYYICIY